MKKVSDAIVNHRYLILVFMILLTAFFGMMIPKVTINEDMTKYLADTSNMKQGIDLLSKEFPDMSVTNEIRIMFTGLKPEEKKTIHEWLNALKYVDSVDYEAESEKYNKGEYTLYKIQTEYNYDSDEETSIRLAVDEHFQGQSYIMEQTSAQIKSLPTLVIVIALTVILVILFAMSASWLEPFLFMVVIGAAVVLNMGTNIFKDSVSQTTFAITAILQLVLSMDYSIIIMNRYRLELAQTENPVDAVKRALKNAFSSVTSSAVTTIVGLLMLVFMSFKIGADLGIVLAKGVAFSLLCVFTILPALIVMFHKALDKTRKPVLPIPTNRLAAFSHKCSAVLAVLFVVVFAGSFYLQTKTEISFATEDRSKINPIFPADNTTVVLYNNEDEENLQNIVDELDQDELVTSAISLPTLLGKQQTSAQLMSALSDMSKDMNLEEYMLKLMYYAYHNGDELLQIKLSDLLQFISEEVVENEDFAQYIDGEIRDNIDQIKKFSNEDTLTEKMTVEELSEFFGMPENDLRSMFVLYYADHDGAKPGKMTLAEFVEFLENDILEDPSFSKMIDSSMKEQLETFRLLTDADAIAKKKTSKKAAKLLGMDPEQMKLLYVYYFANKASYDAGTMSLPDFVSYLVNEVSTNKMFSDYMEEGQLEQLKQLEKYTSPEAISVKMTPAEMAEYMTMEESEAKSIFKMYYGDKNLKKTKLTMTEVLEYISTHEEFTSQMKKKELEQLEQGLELMKLIDDGKKYTYDKVAPLLTMKEEEAKQVYVLYAGENAKDKQISPIDFVDYMLSNPVISSEFDEEKGSQMQRMSDMMHTAQAEEECTCEDMATMLTMDVSMVKMVYTLKNAEEEAFDKEKKLSVLQLVDYLKKNREEFGELMGEYAGAVNMLHTLLHGVAENEKYTYKELAKLFDMAGQTSMDEGTEALAQAAEAENSESEALVQATEAENGEPEALAQAMEAENGEPEALAQVAETENGEPEALAQATEAENEEPEALAQATEAEKDKREEIAVKFEVPKIKKKDLKQLYLLRVSKYGDTSDWGMSPSELVSFIQGDILTNKEYSKQLDKDSVKMLDAAQKLMDAIISEKAYSVQEATSLLSDLSDQVQEGTLRLLYQYYGSLKDYDAGWTMSILQLFDYISEDLLNNPDFVQMLDEQTRTQIEDAKTQLKDAEASLKGENYSLLSVSTIYPEESEETMAFMEQLTQLCKTELKHDHYLIGSSAMYYEMKLSFKDELLTMTLLTACSIFLIILLTFRKLLIPVILVLLVQSAVFITAAVSFLQGYSVNYLAYLIVQCILMGATIDYGILFTNNYREYRLGKGTKFKPGSENQTGNEEKVGTNNEAEWDMEYENGIVESLRGAYHESSHTILTSGLIMITVTFIMGFASSDPNIGPICQTIAIGATAAVVLILFVLPGMLSVFDRFVVKK